MKINVKSLQGDEYNVDIQNDQLVSDLKASIGEKANGLPVERQKLVYKGRTMQDTSAVGDYNLEDGCKVHLILQKEVVAPPQATASSSSSLSATPSSATITTPHSSVTTKTTHHMEATTTDRNQSNITTTTNAPNAPPLDTSQHEPSRFEKILRERLAQFVGPRDVEKIMVNLHHEINADINSSSLDDLERLAKQKLNISNE